jgi:uncharacterized RDD family membrane protein YckC
VTRAPDALLELHRHGVAGEAAPRGREVGGGRAVERPEAREPFGAEPLRAPARVGEQPVELAPRAPALLDETIYIHGVEYDDVLTIATPEGVEAHLTLAGPATRFVSALVDILIQIVVLTCVAIVLGVVGSAGLDGGGGAVLLWFLISFAVITLYDIFFEVFRSGRTPGKALNGLRVVRVQGAPVTFLTSAIRNVLRPVDFLPSAYLLGAVVILVSGKNQRLGDIVAGTLVVREPKGKVAPAPVVPMSVARPEPGASPEVGWDTSAVTQEELVAVRQFLQRRYDIEADARSQLARTLAARLRPKIAGAPTGLDAESFLQTLVAAKTGRTS